MKTPYIDIHTHHRRNSKGVIALYSYQADGDEVPAYAFSVGIHPWDAAAADKSWLGALCSVTMIGEIGLDKRSDVPMKIQKAWLISQMDIAEARRIPVIIHCRKAYNELAEILKPYTVPVILHNFIGSVEMAEGEMKRCYLSFGKRLFGSPKSIAALKAVAADRLFFETDNALTPTIEEIYAEAAKLRGENLDDLKTVVYNNFRRLFPDIKKSWVELSTHDILIKNYKI